MSIIVWLLFNLLTGLALLHLRQQMLNLQEAKAQQDALVDIRTDELRKEAQERQRTEERLRMLINASGEGIYGVDFNGECTFCNPVALELLGYRQPAELLGKNMHDLVYNCQHAHMDDHDQQCKLNAYRQGLSVHSEGAFCRADGTELQVEFRSHPIEAEEQVIGAVVTFADITERKHTQEQIWHQANYDSLTKLPNRNLFNDRLDQAIVSASRTISPLAVLFIDLDEFKAVNDSFGHAAGDELLKEVARRLTGLLRDSDTVARLSGDEFTLILPNISNAEDAETIATKILDTLNQPYDLSGQEARISASIGISLYPGNGTTGTVLLRHADEAMYRAKESGRNKFTRYQPST